jgi:hypothetical protein
MNLDTVIAIIAIFVAGFRAGEIFFTLRIREAVRQEAKKQGISIEDDEVVVRKLVVEKADNSLLLYDFENKSFICQGRTIQELAKNSKEYGGVDVAVVVHEKEHYFFINGDIKDSL